jgi:hypothetical protein
MIRDDYEFYKDHKDEFLEKYNGKYLLIHAKELIGVYETETEALQDAVDKGYQPGKFLVHHCIPEEEQEMRFYSRVSFSSYA